MTPPNTSAPVTVPSAQFYQLRQQLLDRGKKLQEEAKACLRYVVVLLFVGLTGIVTAAYLPKFDLKVQRTDAIQALIDTRQQKIDEIAARHLVPRGMILRRIELADDKNGIAVGENGTILTTNDFGKTWTEQASGTQVYLRGVALAAAGNGIAVGRNGTIRTTNDFGKTWTKQASGTEEILHDIALTAAAGNGIAVGRNGTIRTTNDFGKTWTKRSCGTEASREVLLYDVALAAAGNGIAVGEKGTICTTDNFGMTWAKRPNDTEAPFFGIALTAAGNGIAVGRNGTILTTNDFGMTWAKRSIDTEAPLYDVALAAAGNGIAVGTSVGINTDDSGLTWTRRISSEEETREEEENLHREIRDLEAGGTGQVESPSGDSRELDRVAAELMRTGPIRLGIVVLLLFLVQVLVSLNRYNTRLAAFYLARADTLLLLADGTRSVPLDAAERLMQTLSPDQLDFGRTPKAVAQHAVDLARALSTSRRS